MAAPTSLGDFKSMRIGCDNVVCALLTKDDDKVITQANLPTAMTEIQWGTIFKLPGVQAMNINPNMNIETAFYDDGPGEVATTLGNIEVSFDKSSLSANEKAALLGKSIIQIEDKPSSGTEAKKTNIVVSSSNDVPPWVAIGFRTMRGDGKYRYIWLLKGKFIDPVDNNETKADTVNFQNEQLVGRFVKTNASFQIMTQPVTEAGITPGTLKILKPWKTEMEEADIPDTTGDPKFASAWFDQVVTPLTKFAQMDNILADVPQGTQTLDSGLKIG